MNHKPFIQSPISFREKGTRQEEAGAIFRHSFLTFVSERKIPLADTKKEAQKERNGSQQTNKQEINKANPRELNLLISPLQTIVCTSPRERERSDPEEGKIGK